MFLRENVFIITGFPSGGLRQRGVTTASVKPVLTRASPSVRNCNWNRTV
jgi:hypothetical protein